MLITHYLYNSFIIQSGNKKLAIDPGALCLYFFRLTTLIPKAEWKDISHILVTHGDIDHYWHADKVAQASGAPIICNENMVRTCQGERLLLGPRNKGVVFTTPLKKLHTIAVDRIICLDGMSITGIRTTHGPLTLKFGPFLKKLHPGPKERIGWGAIGFHIQLDGRTIVNLGDTLLHKKEWRNIESPDVLMLRIGGKAVHNTMDEQEALQAVDIMRPKVVIPCHYNCPAFFSRKYNPADARMFQKEVEKMGIKCRILEKGDSIVA